MYDWPETRAQTDEEWARIGNALRQKGIDAPYDLVRRNADLPAIPGGVRDGEGRLIAPDPAALSANELDLAALWCHPSLLLAQACWGPIDAGLSAHVQVIGQPDYSRYEGGKGIFYSSAILMRRANVPGGKVRPADDGSARIPVELLRNTRFAFNDRQSMSGLLALERDLANIGGTSTLFSEKLLTGSHRASILAVAEGRADVCAIDCRSWALALQYEPAAAELVVAGWTAPRPGLPFVTSKNTAPSRVALLRNVLAVSG